MDNTTIGIDVSKAKLDIFFSNTGEYITVANNLKGFKVLFNYIKHHCPCVERIVIEHTGSYQKEVVSFLQDKNLPVCVIQPTRARNYAKTIGRLAKTDKIDAELLALYGQKMEPEISVPQTQTLKELRDLVKFRRQINDMLTLTKQWLDKRPLSRSSKRIERLKANFKKQIADVETEILNMVYSDEQLKRKFEKLVQTKGIGHISACLLLAELPELGSLSKNKIVALCGLAPMNRDSGTQRGKACIQGGRQIVRNALYMAAISSIKWNKIIHNRYQFLREKGKPARVAIVACMRKLIIHLNRQLQNL